MGKRLHLIALLASVLMLATAAPALAWREGSAIGPGDPGDCVSCHSQDFPPTFPTRAGPHNGYISTSTKCAECHTVHNAADPSIYLLPGATIKATCGFCHDGTGGSGPYGSVVARGLGPVGADHSIDTTNVVPGGDAATGGGVARVFSGENAYLSCDDCHNPHDAQTVDPFSGDRVRWHESDLGWVVTPSTHLLKRRPTTSPYSVTKYGSDWCAACHLGRMSGGAVRNHPVDSINASATAFHYERIAAVKTDVSSETTITNLGLQLAPARDWSNRGYVMPWPRTAEQGQHKPICQQCHEDSRQIGQVGAVQSAHVYRYGDGLTADDAGLDNPLFQNFPHETQNRRLLVETYDDLCDNCHPLAQLP